MVLKAYIHGLMKGCKELWETMGAYHLRWIHWKGFRSIDFQWIDLCTMAVLMFCGLMNYFIIGGDEETELLTWLTYSNNSWKEESPKNIGVSEAAYPQIALTIELVTAVTLIKFKLRWGNSEYLTTIHYINSYLLLGANESSTKKKSKSSNRNIQNQQSMPTSLAVIPCHSTHLVVLCWQPG